MIFNLKFLEKITSQILNRKKAKKEKLITEEILDIKLTEVQITLLEDKEYRALENDIRTYAKLYNDGSSTIDGFHYIKSSGIEGVALELNESSYPEIEWPIYIQHLINKLKELRYIKQYAAVETSQQNTDIMTEYMHYYKPSFRLSKTLPAEQLHGNITIQINYINDIPKKFMIKANTYSDRNYKTPKSFTGLLNHLLN